MCRHIMYLQASYLYKDRSFTSFTNLVSFANLASFATTKTLNLLQ
jgi:hypothetical protein